MLDIDFTGYEEAELRYGARGFYSGEKGINDLMKRHHKFLARHPLCGLKIAKHLDEIRGGEDDQLGKLPR